MNIIDKIEKEYYRNLDMREGRVTAFLWTVLFFPMWMAEYSSFKIVRFLTLVFIGVPWILTVGVVLLPLLARAVVLMIWEDV